ncbi:MAG: hypothetical protein WC783_04820 [Candidatus Paceibacterota bacterium]|jgi:hypothetical protein
MLFLFLRRGTSTEKPVEINADSEREAFTKARSMVLGVGRMFAVGTPVHGSVRIFQIEGVNCYQVFAPREDE